MDQLARCMDSVRHGLDAPRTFPFSQSEEHCAIGLQTDCMVAVPAPVVRLPDSQLYALWP